MSVYRANGSWVADEMMGYTYLTEFQRARFDEWFTTASDDDRAECVVCWNWGLGGGVETLQSIVERPDCDVTTALTIFWSSEAVSHLAKYPNEEEAIAAGQGDMYKLHASIIRRYKKNGYAHSGLELDPSQLGASLSEVESLAQHGDLAAAPAMALPITGRPRVCTTQFEMYGVPLFIDRLESSK